MEKFTIENAVDVVVNELKGIWSAFSITVREKRAIKVQTRRFFEKYIKLKKSKNRKTGKQLHNQTVFKSTFANLFNIAAAGMAFAMLLR